MTQKRFNAEWIRAVIQTAERRLAETRKDVEANDMDERALALRLREIERGLRHWARAEAM